MLPAPLPPPITIEAQLPTAQGKPVITSLFEEFSTHSEICCDGAAWLRATRYPRFARLHRNPTAGQRLSNRALGWD